MVLMLICFFLPSLAKSYINISGSSRYSNSTSGSFMISYTCFIGLSSSSYGGAVDLEGSSSTLTMNFGAFSGCYSSYGGGGIYYGGSGFSMISCIYLDCCSSYSTWGYNGQAFDFELKSTYPSGTIQHVSVVRCSNTSTIGPYCSCQIEYSNLSASYVNSSNNYLSETAGGFLFRRASPFSASFFNVVNCTSLSVGGTLYFDYIYSGTFNYSNAIYNTQASGSNGFVLAFCETAGYVLLSQCIFKNNTGASLFSGCGNGYVYATNCWVSHIGYSLTGIQVSLGTIYTTVTPTFDIIGFAMKRVGPPCSFADMIFLSSDEFSLYPRYNSYTILFLSFLPSIVI